MLCKCFFAFFLSLFLTRSLGEICITKISKFDLKLLNFWFNFTRFALASFFLSHFFSVCHFPYVVCVSINNFIRFPGRFSSIFFSLLSLTREILVEILSKEIFLLHLVAVVSRHRPTLSIYVYLNDIYIYISQLTKVYVCMRVSICMYVCVED